MDDEKADDSVLYKLSTRVRGSGKVGEMGTLINQTFDKVIHDTKHRRAILVIDEGDSLAAARSQDHSHHEDKVAVNTLIQRIDELKRFRGRILIILCTNRLSVLDPAIVRRAAIVEEFRRPTDDERRDLFQTDLEGLVLSPTETRRNWLKPQEIRERTKFPGRTLIFAPAFIPKRSHRLIRTGL